MPEQIQLSRRSSWRRPEGAVVVALSSLWGNPYRIGHTCPAEGITRSLTRQEAVERHEAWLTGESVGASAERACARRELRGQDLACWCPLEGPCHGDVLVRLANEEPA
ncbi:DUF4326 domain-containing protein [Pseudoroseicyclus sp. H15]